MKTQFVLMISSTVALLISGALATPAAGSQIFFESMTGAQLAESDAVTFPRNRPSVRGASLDFVNHNEEQILMKWDLLPSEPRGPLRFTIDVNYSPNGHSLDDDADPVFAITDGTNFAGIFRVDNDNSSVSTLEGTVSEHSVKLGPGDSVTTGLGSVQPFSFELSTGPTMIGGYSEGTFESAVQFEVPGADLDSSSALSLILASGCVSHGERYRLHSLRVSVEEIPEPATWGMVLLAVGAVAGFRVLRGAANLSLRR